MTEASQLFLLADRIKLSLLERQRATSLNVDDYSHDGHISRLLDQLRTGIVSLRKEKCQHEQEGEEELSLRLVEPLFDLEQMFNDFKTEAHNFYNTSTTTKNTSRKLHSRELADDDLHALPRTSKTFSFSNALNPHSGDLFESYQDDYPSQSADHRDEAPEISNQQLQQHHMQIIEDQDEQLDRLGESIGRQREMSMQIGDELDHHVILLDEMDAIVDRHQGRLSRAIGILGRVTEGARENKQTTAIIVLIVILALLVTILK
ncbi:hypothetical protein E4U61_006981 [Claviceps capensis]|nr:hypothetical protein E4U61_006981 [Claviceps capensis]